MRLTSILVVLITASCIAADPASPVHIDSSCVPRTSLDGLDVARCVRLNGIIDERTYSSADSLVRPADALVREQQGDSGSLSNFRGFELDRKGTLLNSS